MRAKFFFILFLALASSCSWLERQKYQTYKHPSLSFSIDYPSGWEIQEGGAYKTQVSFLSNKQDVFRANTNIVVTKPDQQNLEKIKTLSRDHLSRLLNQYKILNESPVKFGNVDAFELRATYKAKEGMRIIRSVVALKNDLQYVFTFTSSLESENNYTDIINHMIQSFTL